MSTACNLALEALRSLDSTLKFEDWENGDGEEIGAQLREAVAALEAETGEPVAYMTHDGRVSMRSTVESSMSSSSREVFTIPLYTSPPPAVQGEPYAWTVSASGRMWFGKYAENDARIEAKHCGGSCEAYPLYRWAP